MIQRWYWHKKSDGRVLEVADDLGGWVRYDDHVAALAAAHASGVREGIERVRLAAEGPWCGCDDGLSVEDTCNDALAAFNAEQEQDDG